MPEEVRAEICPYFLERSAIKDESLLTQKIIRLNGNAEFVRSGLTVSSLPTSPQPHHYLVALLSSILTQYLSTFLQPRRSDLDMNQHVNNVKYIGWMMEVSSAVIFLRTHPTDHIHQF